MSRTSACLLGIVLERCRALHTDQYRQSSKRADITIDVYMGYFEGGAGPLRQDLFQAAVKVLRMPPCYKSRLGSSSPGGCKEKRFPAMGEGECRGFWRSHGLFTRLEEPRLNRHKPLPLGSGSSTQTNRIVSLLLTCECYGHHVPSFASHASLIAGLSSVPMLIIDNMMSSAFLGAGSPPRTPHGKAAGVTLYF